jgi:hypothetical protein
MPRHLLALSHTRFEFSREPNVIELVVKIVKRIGCMLQEKHLHDRRHLLNQRWLDNFEHCDLQEDILQERLTRDRVPRAETTRTSRYCFLKI